MFETAKDIGAGRVVVARSIAERVIALDAVRRTVLLNAAYRRAPGCVRSSVTEAAEVRGRISFGSREAQ